MNIGIFCDGNHYYSQFNEILLVTKWKSDQHDYTIRIAALLQKNNHHSQSADKDHGSHRLLKKRNFANQNIQLPFPKANSYPSDNFNN